MDSKSGYDCSLFLAEPDDDLKCLLCLGVAREPLQHQQCGRLFCKCCIEEYGKDKPCPHCRDLHSSYYQDKRGKRAIQQLKVKCSERECEWEGTVEALDKHLDQECLEALLPCKYVGLGCGVNMKRPERAAHEQDDKVHLHMALDTISTMRNQQHQYTFRLTGYQDKKERGAWLYSKTFYTSSTGYKVHVGVLPKGRGDGEGTHVSVCMRDGEYDSQLNWPLVDSVTFTLLNQLEDKNHHSETLTLTRHPFKPEWIDEFIPHSALGHDPIKNTQYLKDDTVYFRVSMAVQDDQSTGKPWLTTFPSLVP